MLQLYGLKNCDSTKKAIDMLKGDGVSFQFHDYKTEGADPENLQLWLGSANGKDLLNKKGTTWRGLTKAQQQLADTAAGAIQLMQEHTSLIKRPVAVAGKKISIGFKENDYQQLFLKPKK